MKVLITVLVSLIALAVNAQDKIHQFQATKVNINQNGQKVETSTTEPSTITIDLEKGTLTLETNSAEIREMIDEKVVMNIDKQMGKVGPQYSLQLDEFILAHIYMNTQMIMFTRTDTHPLQWGIQFIEVQKEE